MLPDDATNEIISEYEEELNDIEQTCVFWLALAATQWNLGRLQDHVKHKALEIIESGQDLTRWSENEKDRDRRQAVLQKLKQQLQSEQPIPKKVAAPFIRSTKMEPGDILSYHLSNGYIALLRVLRIKQDQRGDRYPQIQILDYFERTIPAADKVHKLKLKPTNTPDMDSPNAPIPIMKPSGSYFVAPYGKSDPEPWDKLDLLIKGTKIQSDSNGNVSLLWWRELENFLMKLFNKRNTPL